MNIVLVHGILGFREKFGIEYFNGVKERLAKTGAAILVPQLDATGPIKTRGEELRALIWAALSDHALDPSQSTHIIAHSQGGLDARFMLSPQNPHTTPENDLSGKVISLTTISSPHQGSPIADLLLLKPVDSKLSRLEQLIRHPDLGEELVKRALTLLDIDSNALSDLSTENMARFNREFLDHPKVRYFSVAGVGRAGKLPTSLALAGFHHHMQTLKNEPNDGLVPVSSAQRWPSGSETWPADHADEIGHNLNDIELRPLAGFDYLAKYEALAQRVAAP
jgi:triacylglycerol lipase